MTRRLVLLLTGVAVLLWLFAAGLGALVMREEFDEVFDSALTETAQRLLPLVVDDIFRRNSADGPMQLPHSPQFCYIPMMRRRSRSQRHWIPVIPIPLRTGSTP
jgi:hypothetical protein